MKMTLDGLGARLFAVYLDGEKVRLCMAADDAAGWVDVDDGAITPISRRVWGQVEFRLVPATTAETQAAIEKHYGRSFERESR